jgi:FkbM family methyltransferase
MRFRTVTGIRLRLLPNASDSLSGFWYQELPDFEELAFTLHILKPDELFVDVGANQGGWALTVAGRGARVIAFEPVPQTYQRLLANVAENPNEIKERIRAIKCGLAEEAGQVMFTSGFDTGNHRIKANAEVDCGTVTVDLVRADTILRGEAPVVLKIDVEGEELGVLKGAREVLSTSSLVSVVVETFRPQNANTPNLLALEELLREHGFLPMVYDPWRRTLQPILKKEEGSQNTIYVRSRDEALSRIRTAPPLSAFGRAI